MENTGTHFETETEKLASAINNLANAIDRLNEQSEHKHKWNRVFDKDGDLARYCLICRKWESLREPQDTPEQTEEWEEEFRGLLADNATLLETTRGVTRDQMKIDMAKCLVDYIKQLLEERERYLKESKIKKVQEWVCQNYSTSASPLYIHVDVQDLLKFLDKLKQEEE